MPLPRTPSIATQSASSFSSATLTREDLMPPTGDSAKRLSVILSEEMFRKARIAAASSGIPTTRVIRAMLSNYLSNPDYAAALEDVIRSVKDNSETIKENS